MKNNVQSHSLHLLGVAQIINPVSPSSAVVLNRWLPVLQLLHSTRRDDDRTLVLSVYHKKRRAARVAEHAI